MNLWLDIAENSDSKSKRSNAEFNLAVGYEIKGNINEAIRWGVKSYETMPRLRTNNYLLTLKKRKQQKENPIK